MTIFYSPSKKGFYDDTLPYPSLPTDLIEIDSLTHKNLINEINSNNKMIVVINGNIILEDKINSIVEQTWDIIRARRNELLRDSDFTQLPDFPDMLKSQWIVYRQALRDLPQTYSNTSDVIWPVKPS